MGRLGLIGLVLAALLSAAAERANAGCCYEETVEWHYSGYVELPGDYGNCSELIVSGDCYFDTYWYYCVDDCGQLCITACYDYGEWLPVAKAKGRRMQAFNDDETHGSVSYQLVVERERTRRRSLG